MKQQYTHLLLSPILMFLLSTASGASKVVSERLVFLKEDGRNYLLQRNGAGQGRKSSRGAAANGFLTLGGAWP